MYLVYVYNHFRSLCFVVKSLHNVCFLFFGVVEAIEVVDTLAVNAFGYPLPCITPRLASYSN